MSGPLAIAAGIWAAGMAIGVGVLGYSVTAFVSNNFFDQLPPEAQTGLRQIGMHE